MTSSVKCHWTGFLMRGGGICSLLYPDDFKLMLQLLLIYYKFTTRI